MKATITLPNGSTAEIELSCEQQEQINKLCKSKFDIDYKLDGCSVVTSTLVEKGMGVAQALIEHGRYRQTPELAEQSLLLNQQMNRLDELVKWLEPKWKANWDLKEQMKAYIAFNKLLGTFSIDLNNTSKSLGTVYMSKRTAITIRDALNNGKLPELAEILKDNK